MWYNVQTFVDGAWVQSASFKNALKACKDALGTKRKARVTVRRLEGGQWATVDVWGSAMIVGLIFSGGAQ